MKKDFWSIFGRFAVIIGVVWALIQICNFIVKPKEYRAQTTGSQYPFLVPNFIKPNLNAFNNTVVDSIYSKIYNTNTEKFYIFNSYTLEQKLKNYGTINRLYSYISGNLTEYILTTVNQYNTVWYFTISNEGNKPLEELCLELPFSGIYSYTNTDTKKTENGSFGNRINLGNIKPSYEVKIIVWMSSYKGYEIYNEEKTRFTHKYGSFKIQYTKEVSGIKLWVVNNLFNIIFILLTGTILSVALFNVKNIIIQAEKGNLPNEKETTKQ